MHLQRIILEERLWLVGNYTVFSAAALWIFDYVQTLPTEIEALWSRKVTGSGALFLINRYLFGIYLVLDLATISPGSASSSSCNTLYMIYSTLQVITVIATNMLFTLRVYAVCSQSRMVLSVASALILARFGLDIWMDYIMCVGGSTQGSPYEALSMCLIDFVDASAPLYERLEVSTVVLTLMFDTFVFGITIVQTYRHACQTRINGQTSINEILLRDGILYFFVVTAVAVADAALRVISVTQNASEISILATTYLIPFFNILPNLLVNRLFLNLRSFIPNSTTSYSVTSGLVFAQGRFLGNIGAPLDLRRSSSKDSDGNSDEEERSGRQQADDIAVGTNAGGRIITLIPVVHVREATEDIELIHIQ